MKTKINLYAALAVCLLGMATITWWSNGYLDEVWDANRTLTKKITELEQVVDSMKPTVVKVVATMYHPVVWQTDSDPHITADGTRIHRRHASKYRFLAVSRNLLKKNGGHLDYGDYVIIDGTNGRYNGVWQIKDTMAKRFINRIDFLCSPGTEPFKFEDVSLMTLITEEEGS